MENPLQDGDNSSLPEPDGIHSVFHHLAAPKAHVYRAIPRLFVSAKERFEIAVGPGIFKI